MNTIEAVFSGGVFRPIGDVPVAENERVRLTIEPVATAKGPGPIRTARDLLDSDLVGIWAGRMDIDNSHAFARRLRDQAQTRCELNHAAR